MDTNQMHPLQVIYESMLEDESFNVDFANNYLEFVKETVPEMMHKEELSEEETLKFVYQDTGTFANLGEGKTNPKRLKGDNKIDNIKLKIFFDNCSEALQDNKLGEIIYNEDTLLQLYKGVITKIDEGKTELDYLKTQKTKQLYVIVNRMLAAVFPQYLGTLVNNITFQNTINRTNEFLNNSGTNDIINTGNSWLECNKHYFEYCNKHIKLTEDEDENKEYHISLLLDYLNRKDINTLMKIYKMKSENIILKETSDLLLQTKNLILTGAPGTGKTYLAKQIADELTNNDSECVSMVQFHPSYDYTDFVEGLRPIDNGNGEIGFERKDGTFKAFCKKATKNFEDSKKTTEVLIKERDIEDLFLDFQDHIAQEIGSKSQFEIEGIRPNLKIPIIDILPTERYTINTATRNQQTINLTPMLDNYYAYKEYIESNNEPVTTKVAKEIFKVTSPTYTYGFVKAFYEFVQEHNKNNTSYDTQKEVKKVETAGTFKLKNFVFIIDEINRGEISKIFGELFYAIDPGYRGKNGRIKTQYQNLIKDTENNFKEGFYVPENVYIIGTMNDIDRSVDSFDFAMRRRFAWKEITAEDTQHSILASLQDDKRNEAINRMNSLNKKISGMPELGTQYQLGASYFLKLEHYDYDFEKLWHFHIKGLLYEYLRGVPGADSKLVDLQKAYELKNEQ